MVSLSRRNTVVCTCVFLGLCLAFLSSRTRAVEMVFGYWHLVQIFKLKAQYRKFPCKSSFTVWQLKKCEFYHQAKRRLYKQFLKFHSPYFVIFESSTHCFLRSLKRGRQSPPISSSFCGWYDSAVSVRGRNLWRCIRLAFWTKIKKEPCCCHIT